MGLINTHIKKMTTEKEPNFLEEIVAEDIKNKMSDARVLTLIKNRT